MTVTINKIGGLSKEDAARLKALEESFKSMDSLLSSTMGSVTGLAVDVMDLTTKKDIAESELSAVKMDVSDIKSSTIMSSTVLTKKILLKDLLPGTDFEYFVKQEYWNSGYMYAGPSVVMEPTTGIPVIDGFLFLKLA